MISLSQNKKIAISAIGVFIVSFMAMLFFLDNNLKDSHMNADILHANEASGHEEDTGNQQESFYRDHMAESTDPFVVTSPEGNIIFASEDFCSLIMVDCENLQDKTLFDYINTKDLSELITAYAKLIQEPKLTEGIGPFRMLKGEDEILILLNAYPIAGKKEKIESLIFSMKDLTKQINELNEDEEEHQKDRPEDETWIHKLYPKIKDTDSDEGVKLVVDKISYKD